MGRIKGSKMTEEAKAAMRARRKANKEDKANALSSTADAIRLLQSWKDCEIVEGLLLARKEELRESERTTLLARRTEIDAQLDRLKGYEYE